jgi:hypothetical protein
MLCIPIPRAEYNRVILADSRDCMSGHTDPDLRLDRRDPLRADHSIVRCRIRGPPSPPFSSHNHIAIK